MSRKKTRPKETSITQNQLDPSTLLDAFDDRPDLDLVREMVGFLYQALIDIEATEVIGAEPPHAWQSHARLRLQQWQPCGRSE